MGRPSKTTDAEPPGSALLAGKHVGLAATASATSVRMAKCHKTLRLMNGLLWSKEALATQEVPECGRSGAAAQEWPFGRCDAA
eukprot:scaffold7606_cov296-Pinguiococcus_pyrenoidosus.AAC.1